MEETFTAVKRPPVLLFSISLYLAACALPALVLHNRAYSDNMHSVWQSYRSIPGIELLVRGLALGWTRFNFTAFCNLPFWISWIQFGRGNYASARVLSAAAIIMSIETIQLAFQPWLYDEGASVKGFLVAPHVGYLCWIASMVLIFAYSRKLGRSDDRLHAQPVRIQTSLHTD